MKVLLKIFLTIGISHLISCSQQFESKEKELTGSDISAIKDCCLPGGGRARIISQISSDSLVIPDGMLLIPAGEFLMGGDDELALPREFPKHPVRVNSFLMDEHEVTNAQFDAFVLATGYKTIAELPVDWEEIKKQLPPGTPKPSEANLLPGSLVFTPKHGTTDLSNHWQWWQWVNGANWQHPHGQDSNIEGMDDHPVVHIAYKDALAYCEWLGKRLPTEAEWEWAARGGLEEAIYPWGIKDVNEGKPQCNFFQGKFPNENYSLDEFEFTAPVQSFRPNGFGLYDMAGNVWEICSDWFDEKYYSTFSLERIAKNPLGPEKSNYHPEPWAKHNTMRGGSFLCNDSYCASYRISARMPLEVDAAMNHVGFRCVKDIN